MHGRSSKGRRVCYGVNFCFMRSRHTHFSQLHSKLGLEGSVKCPHTAQMNQSPGERASMILNSPASMQYGQRTCLPSAGFIHCIAMVT